MKKIIFALFAMAAFAACNNEHTVVTPKGDAIGFANAFVDGTTKAIDPSITTTGDKGIKQFVVYGYTQGTIDGSTALSEVCIFPGVRVWGEVALLDGAATGNLWSYDASYTQYWVEGNQYKFAAVVNGSELSTKAAVKAKTAYGMPTQLTYDAGDQYDLLYAETDVIEGKANGQNTAVEFTFNHLLSKAVFTFTNTTATTPDTAYNYTVEGIVIEGLGEVATYDLTGTTTPAWTVTTGSYTEEFGNIVAAGTAENEDAVKVHEGQKYSSNYERLLIPGTYDLTVKFKISLLYGDALVKVENYTAQLDDFVFEQGKAYSFNLTAGLYDKINFTVTKVNDWQTPTVEEEIEVEPYVPAVPQP